jgi:ubiquinone/menaquinone biosynthesis C-methylase UbiE
MSSPLLGILPQACFLSRSLPICNPGRPLSHDQGVSEHPIFARFYDRMTARAERGGLGEMRRELLANASGRVLELGAGTGHNLPYYTDAVTELVMIEPDPHMARRLRERLAEETGAAANPTVVEAPAEQLPFDDGSFDAVVATLVFCTVDDQQRALAEARRVLVEGGLLLYLEHIRSSRPGLGRWQDLLQKPWGLIAGGCHPNRPTDQAIADAGFWIDSLERDKLPKAPPLVRPLIHGVARRPSGVGSS